MWWMKQWIICIWNHSQSIIVSTIWNNQKPITNNQAWISKKNNLKLKLRVFFYLSVQNLWLESKFRLKFIFEKSRPWHILFVKTWMSQNMVNPYNGKVDKTQQSVNSWLFTWLGMRSIQLHFIVSNLVAWNTRDFIMLKLEISLCPFSILYIFISDKSNSLVSKYSVNFDVKIWPGNVLYKINIHGCVEVEINVQCFKKNSGSWNILRGKNSLLLFFLSSCVLKQDISKNNNKNDHLLNPNGPKREWCATTHHLFTEGHHIM